MKTFVTEVIQFCHKSQLLQEPRKHHICFYKQTKNKEKYTGKNVIRVSKTEIILTTVTSRDNGIMNVGHKATKEHYKKRSEKYKTLSTAVYN